LSVLLFDLAYTGKRSRTKLIRAVLHRKERNFGH